MQINALGLIPYITAEDLQKLSQEGQALIQRELSRAETSMAFQDDLSTEQIRNLMEALEVLPVWGREGMVVYRLIVEGKTLVFGIAPDIEKDTIPVNILEREFIVCESIPDLLDKMVAWAKTLDPATLGVLLPEDHPEERSIGFIAPDANKVWLLDIDIVGKDLLAENTGNWAQVPHLLQSNQGRLELGYRIIQGRLQTQEEFQAQFNDLSNRTPQPGQVTRKQQQEIIIDLLSGQLSSRYKDRYLPKKES